MSLLFPPSRRPALTRALALACAMAAPVVLAGAGDVDATYAGGAPHWALSTATDTAIDAQILSGGKLLIGARCGATPAFCLRRIGSDGVADTTFGSNGLLTLPLADGGEMLRALVPLDSGSYYAVGTAGDNGSVAVARLKADGVLDTEFNTTGYRINSAPAEAFTLRGVVPTAATRALVVGQARINADTIPTMFMTRIGADGNWDPALFGAGKVFVPVVIDGVTVPAIAVTALYSGASDARIWLLGRTDLRDGGDVMVLSRHFLNGQIDSAFGSNGVKILGVGGPAYPVALHRDRNGRVFVLGERTGGASGEATVVVAFKADGNVDTTFGSQGMASYPQLSAPFAMTSLPDGRLLVAGQNVPTGTVLRLTSAGALDSGKAVWTVPAGVTPNWLALRSQTNGRVVLAGSDVGVARAVRFESDDITPAPFAFAAKTDVNPGSSQNADEVTITGIDAPSPISIVGGTYAIADAGKCGDAATNYTAAEGVYPVSATKRLCVRATASSENSKTTKATVTIADVSADFSLTTVAKKEDKKSGGSASLLSLLGLGALLVMRRQRQRR